MQAILILIILIGSGFLNSLFAQSYDTDNLSNIAVERKIIKAINKLPYYGVFDQIGFEFNEGKVILTGKVAVSRNKRDAESCVKRVKGVREVVNNIEILPLSSFDNAIRYRLLRTLNSRGGSLYRYLREPGPSVRLIVKGGNVSLEGLVANRGDYNLMNVLANGVSGVFSVKNNLIVEKEQVR